MVGFQAPAAKRDRKALLFGPLYSHVQSNFLFQAPHIIENRNEIPAKTDYQMQSGRTGY